MGTILKIVSGGVHKLYALSSTAPIYEQKVQVRHKVVAMTVPAGVTSYVKRYLSAIFKGVMNR